MRVYLAHAVTGAPAGTATAIQALGAWLRAQRFEVTQPTAGLSPLELAATTLESVRLADLVVADLTVSSHGVGFEVGFAYAHGKRVVFAARTTVRRELSRFLLSISPDVVFYDSSEDLVRGVALELRLPAPTARTGRLARQSTTSQVSAGAV